MFLMDSRASGSQPHERQFLPLPISLCPANIAPIVLGGADSGVLNDLVRVNCRFCRFGMNFAD